jgi:hypothetical protein
MSAPLFGCGSSASSSDKANEGPQEILDEATVHGIESGVVNASLSVDAPGKEGGNLFVRILAPFQSEGEDARPRVDIAAEGSGTYNGNEFDFENSLMVLPDSAYVGYEGVEYEIDESTLGFFESTLQQAQRENGGEAGSAAACREELTNLRVADLVENANKTASANLGGAYATKVYGELDASAAIDAVTESQACLDLLAAFGPLPPQSEVDRVKGELTNLAKNVKTFVYVDKEDDIVREIVLRGQIEPKSGPKRINFDFQLSLEEINEEQDISAPEDAEPLSALFIKLGISPVEAFGLLQGGIRDGIGELFERLGIS